MSFYNPYQTGWNAYRQNQSYGGNGQQGASQGHGSPSAQGSSAGALSQASGQSYPFASYASNPYQGGSSDMQYMIQLMINLGNQLDKLNQLIAQNNQLLQSKHDQEDTKCVQGSGGGTVIVRM
ncbi:hypothetical protein [Metabacillus sp. RGM 3146]|uniref:hypothetical protein n=1 Tax=Metabacillus sp. RGM 3146 TaxID=3401092 RepID=UPI003B9B7665